MKVSWDAAKDLANQKKHGISFEEAQSLFETDDYFEIFDEIHSDVEDRFIAIGLIRRGLILVVWTQSEEETVRIISARSATKAERAMYESYMGRKHDRHS